MYSVNLNLIVVCLPTYLATCGCKLSCEIAVADVFDGVFLCCLFSHETSWMRSENELSQFRRVFLATLAKSIVGK